MNKKKTDTVSSLDNIKEEDSRLSLLSTKSDPDDSSKPVLFGMSFLQ